MNYKEMTEDEIIESVRNHTLWWCHTQEGMIKHLGEWKTRVIEEGQDPHINKSCMMMDIHEYQITETFQVGVLTVGVLGKERTDKGFMGKEEVDTRGRYCIYKGTPDRWVKEKTYCTRTEIEEIARQMADIEEKGCESVTVTFPTGELVFANFFCEDRDTGLDILPKDIQYKEKYSINTSLGVQNTMEWLAENRGIAYGQLGNTSCHIYKAGGDKIYVTSAYAYMEDEDDYEVDLPVPEGWVFVGEISCGVWRFEAIDKQRFTEHNFDLVEYKKEQEYQTFPEVKVNPGEWDMKCYHQHMSDKKLTEKFGFPVWATLTRKV